MAGRENERARNNGGSDNFRALTFWEGTTPDDNFTFPLTSNWVTYELLSSDNRNASELAGAKIILTNQSGTFDVDVSELEVELVP